MPKGSTGDDEFCTCGGLEFTGRGIFTLFVDEKPQLVGRAEAALTYILECGREVEREKKLTASNLSWLLRRLDFLLGLFHN